MPTGPVTGDKGRDVRPRQCLRGALIVPITPEVREELLTTIPSLRAFAISLCADVDRADDLVQEAITRAITHIGPL
jgi:hypothetical protein